MRILLAPDKFKGTLSAPQVAHSLARGLREAAPHAVVTELPVADGGDGTVAALAQAGFALHPVEVEGPLGEPVLARFAVRGDVAVVEMAQTSGLALLRAPGPLRASSFGLGQAIVAAIDLGCREVVAALGGSAGTDGGAGMLQALGARLLDAAGRPIGRGGAGLAQLRTVDLAPAVRRLSGVCVVAACDVANPLLGPAGAARVYGPQKGATPEQVPDLERGLARFAALMERSGAAAVVTQAGAGAAGGTGYALLALGAQFRRGADLLLEALDFLARVAAADLVVTGEGALDEQTLQGKAPLAVAAAAGRAGVPVIAVVGRNELTAEQMRAAGFARVHALTDHEPDLAACHADAAPLLRRLGRLIAAEAGQFGSP